MIEIHLDLVFGWISKATNVQAVLVFVEIVYVHALQLSKLDFKS